MKSGGGARVCGLLLLSGAGQHLQHEQLVADILIGLF